MVVPAWKKKSYEFTAGGEKVVERRNMIGNVGDKDFHTDLDQEQHEEFLERIGGVEESETDEEDFEVRNIIIESDESALN